MSPSLGLHYAPHLNAHVVDNLERAGRQCGLPLAQLELLGQDETVALDFIASVIGRYTMRYLAEVDWDRLEALYQSHKVSLPQILANA